MIKKTWLLVFLMTLSIGTRSFAVDAPDRHANDRRTMFMFNLGMATLMAAVDKGPSDALSLFSQEMNTTLLIALLSKTSLKDYSVPLAFTVLHGRDIIKFGVNNVMGVLAFRTSYKKAYGTTDGWMTMYAKRLPPFLVKKTIVNYVMKGITKGAQAVGITYPEQIRNNMWLMNFAMQVPLFVQGKVAHAYDEAVGYLFA